MSSPRPEARLFTVHADKRYRYGVGNYIEILATNQPESLCLFDKNLREGHPATRKKVSPPASPELERFWLDNFQQTIANLLFNMPVVSQRCWHVGPARMGFEDKELDNPIVIRFTFACAEVSDTVASQVVGAIDDLLVSQGWQGEK
jgi:hypothetical protein